MRKGSTFRIWRVLLPCFLVIIGVVFFAHKTFAATESEVLIAAAGYTSDWVLSLLADILNSIASILGRLALVLIEVIIVPILNYNSFSTSTVISLGWSLMRDIVNMFVIIALLAIAILTIVGNERAHWEQQLPRLFLAVVMVNFSRTICGLLIDVSQVVMFTFVNALLDIAAGNFAQLFGLNNFGKIDDITASTATDFAKAHLFNGFSNVGAAFLQIPLYGSIVAILLLLALAFLYRIVVLWLLVILSPAAFFLGGMHEVFHIGGAHAWWEKFTGALVMGPLLTFFLWLALAASSAGSITQTENFPVPDNPESYGISLEAFSSSSIVSTLVALVLLIVGMQQAGSYASKVGSVAGGLINEKMGQRVVTETAKFLPVTVGGAAARNADRYAAPILAPGSVSVSQGIGKKLVSTGSGIANATGNIPVLGGLGFGLGRQVMKVGGKFEAAGEGTVHADMEAAKARVAAMSDTQKAEEYSLIAIGKQSKLLGRRDDYEALAADIATKGKMQKETKDHIKHHYEEEHRKDNEKRLTAVRTDATNAGWTPQQVSDAVALEEKKINAKADQYVDEKFNAIMGGALETVDKKKNLLLDDAGKQKFNETSSKYADLLKDPKKFIDSDDFVVAKLRDRPSALDNKAVVEALNNKVVRVNKGGEKITAMDQIKAGLAGEKMRDKALGTPASRFQNVMAQPGGPDEKSLQKLFKVDEEGNRGGGEAGVTLADISGPSGDVITNAIVASKIDVTNLGSANPAEAVNVRQQFVNNVVNKQKADVVQKAITNGQVAPRDIPAAAFSPANANRVELVKGIVQGRPDVTSMSRDAQDALNTAVRDLERANALNAKQASEAKEMLLGAGRQIEEILSGATLANGTISLDPGARRELRDVLRARPENYHLIADMSMGTGPNDVTQTVAAAVTKEDIQKLGALYSSAEGQQKEQLKNALEAIHHSLAEEISATNSGLPGRSNKGSLKRLNELDDASTQVRERIGL